MPLSHAIFEVGRLGRLGNAESQLEASTEGRCRPGLNWEKLGDNEKSGRHSSLGRSLVQPSQGLGSSCNWWGMEREGVFMGAAGTSRRRATGGRVGLQSRGYPLAELGGGGGNLAVKQMHSFADRHPLKSLLAPGLDCVAFFM